MNNPSISSPSTSITSLPRAILLKILTGLPAKSTVRFRCTSKFFYSFVPEPRFAFKILFALPSRILPSLNLYSVSYSEESHGNLHADTAQHLDVRGLVYSADGKMCLYHEMGGEAVFDLSTGRRIFLPSIDWPAGRDPSSFSLRLLPCSSLGFDSVSERYKVFKSLVAVYYNYDSPRVLNRLWVLNVGVDKSWREIDCTITGYTRAAVHINGIIYLIPDPESLAGDWTGACQHHRNLLDSSSIEPKIVAINVATESFITSIPFPFEYHSLPHRQGGLTWMKLNGCLAFINILGPQNASETSLWMKLNGDLVFMNPRKVSEIPTSWPDRVDIWRWERSMEWAKQTILLPLEEGQMIGEATSMGFTENSMGEILFLIQTKRKMSPLVLVYSFGREVWRRFEIPGVCNYSHSLSYMRGLVHVEDEITTFLE